MAKKLAPLVIPAVIDTSGIDRGVNNIRSKLSRVRGGGNVGGGGGFGSGINPYPGGFGGSAVGAGMAAAFGAAAGTRAKASAGIPLSEGYKAVAAFSNRNEVNRQTLRNFNRSSIVGGIFQDIADRAAAERRTTSGMARDLRREAVTLARGPFAWNDAERINQNYKKVDFLNARTDYLSDKVKRNATRATRASKISERLAQYSPSGLGAGLSIGGAFGAAFAAVDFMSARSMESRFGDITRFEGSKDYESIRRLKASSYQTPEQGRAQAFFVGAQNAAGGRRPMIQQFGEQLNQSQQSVFQSLGSATEQAFTIGFQAVYQLVEAGMSSRANLGAFGNQLRRAIN